MRWPNHAARQSLDWLLVGLVLGWAGAGCSENDSSGGSGRRGEEPCPPLTYEEFKKVCGDAFTDCLHTQIQGLHTGRDKHSQCVACRDKCMQDKGLWPSHYLGKPCE